MDIHAGALLSPHGAAPPEAFFYLAASSTDTDLHHQFPDIAGAPLSPRHPCVRTESPET